MAHEHSDANHTKLCELCSKLNVQYLAHPLLPCHNPLSCSTPPIAGYEVADYLLGSVDEIKGRRFTCDVCKLVAECLDREPSDLDGTCRFREISEFCNFKLPKNVEARDPTITHFHLTQITVIFDTTAAAGLHGPAFPWDAKERDNRSSHYILGLQAKARSNSLIGNQASVCPQTERELLEIIGGRYVGTQVNAQLVRRWLHDCESKHGKLCQGFSHMSVGRDKAPAFVVDAIQWCLVDTPLQCRYVALSYVWGKAPVFRHLLENTQDIRKPNSLRSLPIPATIRDAITLVHAIGERYLWVDSICIIQDDLKMQQTEIMRMGSIFVNALFTIIAAAGDHANSGLPGVERGSREQVQKIVKIGDCELLTVIDLSNAPSAIDETVWGNRAWTFQERVLSSRLLVFSDNQVYWSCPAAKHSEERALEDVKHIRRHDLMFHQKPSSNLSLELLPRDRYCNLYDDLIQSYRERSLTYQTDILNAFNGVTEMLSAIHNDAFLWGLSESHFSHAIIWDLFGGHFFRNHVEVPIFKSDGSKEMVPIPSWSWAAWSADMWVHSYNYTVNRQDVRPAVEFYLVDNEHKLVRVKEKPWQDNEGNLVLASWPNTQPPLLESLSSSQIGQLHFWTDHAKVRAVRRSTEYRRKVNYTLLTSPDSLPDVSTIPGRFEVVHQDFIVIAARGTGVTLILLAIEWKDGVAYRIGRTEVSEMEWLEVENRQWRLVTLR